MAARPASSSSSEKVDPALAERDRSAPRGRAAARLDGERSRLRILDAAEKLFAERGYAGSGIAAISRASGLPPSSIYWFFDSKQDLAIAVIARGADRWLDALEPPEGGTGRIGEFRTFIDRALDESGSGIPEFARLQMLLALELGPTEPEVLERLRQVRDRGRALIAKTLEADLVHKDAENAPKLSHELSFLAMSFAQGALLGRMLDPDAIDSARLSEDIEVALHAIADHRIERASQVAAEDRKKK